MLNMILVGLMGWMTLSIVIGVATGREFRYAWRRDGLSSNERARPIRRAAEHLFWGA